MYSTMYLGRKMVLTAWKLAILITSAAFVGAVGAKLLQYSTVMVATPKELSATTVTAERFVLVDSSGRRKAEFGTVGENRNWFGCYSAVPGEPVSSLSGPGLVLYGENDKPVLVLHSTTMDAEVSICNKDGKLRAQVGMFWGEGEFSARSGPYLRLFASDRVPSLGADLDSSTSSISLYDPRTKGLVPRVLLQAGKGVLPSSRSLTVFDEKGAVIWRAP